MSFYDTAWVIFIYSILGWCAEVVFAACRRGIFVNRGFLNDLYARFTAPVLPSCLPYSHRQRTASYCCFSAVWSSQLCLNS